MSPSLFDLDGRIVLVTGSGRGIGLVMARGLGRSGARVVLNDTVRDRLDEAVAGLNREGIEAYGVPFDVTRRDQIMAGVEEVERRIGPIGILVNNAGIQRRGPLEDFSEEDWRAILDINLTGVFLVSQQVVKGMIARQSGKIINICSLQSELGRPSIAPYAASKGGAKMLTRAMAVEWGRHNIQVNGIGPGYFITDMTRSLAQDPRFDEWLKSRTPAHRWGDPEELVGTAVFLASPASDFINGQIVYVDGGILAAI